MLSAGYGIVPRNRAFAVVSNTKIGWSGIGFASLLALVCSGAIVCLVESYSGHAILEFPQKPSLSFKKPRKVEYVSSFLANEFACICVCVLRQLKGAK